jgi:RNA polymerase sigma-70 factor (ECF subfamily)
MEEFRAHLETFTLIQIDPRLRCKFDMSDIIQNTLMVAWRHVERIESLDEDGRMRMLRKMLIHRLLDEIDKWRSEGRNVDLECSLDAALAESSCRLMGSLVAEDTPPVQGLIRQEERLRILDALAKLDPRQRDAIILQKYHGWKLAQIGKHLECSTGVVAGLHARGFSNLRTDLSEMENSHV